MRVWDRRWTRWIPLLGVPLMLSAAAAGVGASGPPVVIAQAAVPAPVVDPTDTAGNPVGADGSLPLTLLPMDLLLTNADDPSLLASTAGPAADLPSGPLGVPGVALDAYVRAAAVAPPGCHLSWSLLAGIGRIESWHARGGDVDVAGKTRVPILGPVLSGDGFAAIADTDGGVFDGDAVWDRAVGPMQFIPATWRVYGVDGNGDGRADPSNIYDSTVAAARYLCAGGVDTANPAQRVAAVFRYNHSDSYVATVLLWADAYAAAVHPAAGVPGLGAGMLALPAPGALQPPPVAPPAPPLPLPPVASPAPTSVTSTPPPPVRISTPPPPASTPPPDTTTTEPPPTTTTVEPPPETTTVEPPATTSEPVTTAAADVPSSLAP